MNNGKLNINNSIEFDSEETKQEFYNYIDEVNEYNRKIKNGEETDINPEDLLNKYRKIFYDEELENKLNDIENKKNESNSDNLETTNELINIINRKISEEETKY